MKCLFKDCEEDAILGSNYCTLHKKKGGLQIMRRFREKLGFGFIEDREDATQAMTEDESESLTNFDDLIDR